MKVGDIVTTTDGDYLIVSISDNGIGRVLINPSASYFANLPAQIPPDVDKMQDLKNKLIAAIPSLAGKL